MSYYTERNNLRKPIEHTEIISIEMYGLLFDCCQKYMDNIAWICPEQCPDGRGICGVDDKKLRNRLKFEISTLFTDRNGWISAPESYDEYDQYALLDYIEFIAQNCKDIISKDYHSFFGHYDMSFNSKSVSISSSEFRKEINSTFEKTGLMYHLTEGNTVERVVEHSVLTEKLVQNIAAITEKGVCDLLTEAINFYRQPNPNNRSLSVEKLWDALERLKTYYCTAGLDKKASTLRIVNDMSNGSTDFHILFDDEFRALTTIGNNYRIRHHETTKIEISDVRYYDYFFNRCLSLIAIAIQFLK